MDSSYIVLSHYSFIQKYYAPAMRPHRSGRGTHWWCHRRPCSHGSAQSGGIHVLVGSVSLFACSAFTEPLVWGHLGNCFKFCLLKFFCLKDGMSVLLQRRLLLFIVSRERSNKLSSYPNVGLNSLHCYKHAYSRF